MTLAIGPLYAGLDYKGNRSGVGGWEDVVADKNCRQNFRSKVKYIPHHPTLYTHVHPGTSAESFGKEGRGDEASGCPSDGASALGAREIQPAGSEGARGRPGDSAAGAAVSARAREH